VKVIVTGGAGFVLSNVAARILAAHPEAEVVLLDHATDDRQAAAFLSRAAERMRIVRGDVRDRACLDALSAGAPPTHVIHGAAVTHDAASERADPFRYIDVNFNGTVTVLEWVRTLPPLQRILYVSTGGVYGAAGPLSPVDIQPETGPFDPPELYAATKFAAELMVRRYATLFAVPACRVRLSDVFGPMERPTAARRSMSLPYRMAAAWQTARPLRVSQRALQAGGDYVAADDVAEALLILLTRPALPHDVFNVAAGVWRTVREMLEMFASVAPGFQYEIVPGAEAEIDFDPANRRARYNAYSIARMGEIGWQPRPLAQQFAGYLDWLKQAEPIA
jgi:nucleoside-diphosphate-sugar epimerase